MACLDILVLGFFVVGVIASPVDLNHIWTNYFAMPWKLLKTFQTPSNVELSEFQLDQFQNISENLKTIAEELASLGFVALGHYRDGISKKADVLSSIWIHSNKSDIAVLLVSRSEGRTGETQIDSNLNFSQEYADGEILATWNSSHDQDLPVALGAKVLWCPALWDLAKLYSVHRAMIEVESRGRIPIIPADAKTYALYDAKRSYDASIKAGRFKKDRSGEWIRYTTKGAFRAVWLRRWPWNAIRTRRRQRETDQQLKQLGFVDYLTLRSSKVTAKQA